MIIGLTRGSAFDRLQLGRILKMMGALLRACEKVNLDFKGARATSKRTSSGSTESDSLDHASKRTETTLADKLC